MKKTALSIILIVLLSACAPSEQAVQTALAETQQAAPTTTPIPPSETPTITPSPTLTQTPSPTPTPDIRIIKLDPREYLLTADDLPPEGKYYLPNSSWISPHRNIEILQDWGAESGQKYINATGRLDGWWVDYLRGNNTAGLPEEIYNNIIMYQTGSGAQLSITKYADRIFEHGFIEITDASKIGDVSRTFMLKENGYITYNIWFSHRNYVHILEGYGLESEVKPELIENIAIILIDNLEAAPLSQP